ncbi:hypothetical protein FRB94_010420 [Tulasnella sp. JGI-2019a]|nr:hypothetical protein FRB94_010420 [Tulasnella sp. JGI-2019a]
MLTQASATILQVLTYINCYGHGTTTPSIVPGPRVYSTLIVFQHALLRLSGPTFTITRINVVALQLLGSLVTISFWAAHQVTESARKPQQPPARATFALFIAYVAASPVWPVCVLLDIYRKGALVSRVSVELLLVAALTGLNGYMIPLFIADNRFPFRNGALSVVYSVVEMVVACIIVVISAVYALALHNHLHLHRPEVWSAGVRDWWWFGGPTPAGDFDVDHTKEHSLGATFLFPFAGQSRGLGIKNGFYKPLNHFLSNHTVFRRVTGVEPIWLALVRGIVGLAFLVGLLAYGAIQCIQFPLNEDGNTLPVRPVQKSLWDRTSPFISFENVTVAFTVYPVKSGVWSPNAVPVPPLVEAFDPDGTSRACTVNQTDHSTWNWSCVRPDGLPVPFSDSEGPPGDHSWLDSTQTSIKVTMDWTFVLEAGYDPSTISAVAGLDTIYESLWAPKQNPSILRFQHPSYLKLQKGQQVQASVETFYITKRRLVFLDVFGFTWSPQVLTYHPITSVTPLQTATPINSSLSSVTFYPSFGLQGQHWLEEYRESTVLDGLGSTGTALSSKIDPTLTLTERISYHRWSLLNLGPYFWYPVRTSIVGDHLWL